MRVLWIQVVEAQKVFPFATLTGLRTDDQEGPAEAVANLHNVKEDGSYKLTVNMDSFGSEGHLRYDKIQAQEVYEDMAETLSPEVAEFYKQVVTTAVEMEERINQDYRQHKEQIARAEEERRGGKEHSQQQEGHGRQLLAGQQQQGERQQSQQRQLRSMGKGEEKHRHEEIHEQLQRTVIQRAQIATQLYGLEPSQELGQRTGLPARPATASSVDKEITKLIENKKQKTIEGNGGWEQEAGAASGEQKYIGTHKGRQ